MQELEALEALLTDQNMRTVRERFIAQHGCTNFFEEYFEHDYRKIERDAFYIQHITAIEKDELAGTIASCKFLQLKAKEQGYDISFRTIAQHNTLITNEERTALLATIPDVDYKDKEEAKRFFRDISA